MRPNPWRRYRSQKLSFWTSIPIPIGASPNPIQLSTPSKK